MDNNDHSYNNSAGASNSLLSTSDRYAALKNSLFDNDEDDDADDMTVKIDSSEPALSNLRANSGSSDYDWLHQKLQISSIGSSSELLSKDKDNIDDDEDDEDDDDIDEDDDEDGDIYDDDEEEDDDDEDDSPSDSGSDNSLPPESAPFPSFSSPFPADTAPEPKTELDVGFAETQVLDPVETDTASKSPKDSGRKFSSRDKLPVGYVLKGRYQIDGILGTGGFGVVYSAKDMTGIHDRVAIKTLRHSICDYEVAATRFQREIDLCQSLDNTHIVKIIDHGTTADEPDTPSDEETIYYVMEYLEGRTLEDYLERREKFTFHDVKDIMMQILNGLCAAHDKKIIHRDLKPANIFMKETYPGSHTFQVKILDFGIAKVVNGDETSAQKLTQTGAWMGSPAYMSPEQLKGCALTPASDIFPLGLIMLEMLTGYQAIDGNSAMDAAMTIISPDPVFVEEWISSSSLGTLIQKCLEKNPTDRYADAQALLDDLSEIPDDLLKNEYSSAVLRKRTRPAAPAAGTVSTGTQQIVEPTLANASPLEKKQFGIHIILITLIFAAIIAIFTIIILKTYFDKQYDDLQLAIFTEGDESDGSEDKGHSAVKLSSPALSLVRSATRGNVVGSRPLRRRSSSISSMPPGAQIYRASDNVLVGETPATIDLILSFTPWNVIIKAEGYDDYPLIINPMSGNSIALTMVENMGSKKEKAQKEEAERESLRREREAAERERAEAERERAEAERERAEAERERNRAERRERRHRSSGARHERPKPLPPPPEPEKKQNSWRVEDML